MAEQAKAIGPASCEGCQTSCFASQAGKAAAMRPEMAGRFERMRSFLVNADVAFRSGNVPAAEGWRGKALSEAAAIFESVGENEIRRYAEYMGSMVKRHAGSPESLRFLENGV